MAGEVPKNLRKEKSGFCAVVPVTIGRAMGSSSEILKSAVVAANTTLESLLDLDAEVAKAADLIAESLRGGNKVLICGNGGSAADASHFATEFVVRFTRDRAQPIRRSVFPVMAGYSPLQATIMASMSSSLAR